MLGKVEFEKENIRYEITFYQSWIRKCWNEVRIEIYEYKKIKNDGFEEYEEEIDETIYLCTKTGKINEIMYCETRLTNIAIDAWIKFRDDKLINKEKK